ncbi:NADPH-dependent FMN reductase [Parasphaerochaeta coccoides]|uniref:NADPH-dependent FMN reductase n=1 Tax=Parasphaerochaeta coccoides (strain ATCC BAA-1237 / DSM 17374 / SPN1) TaxID=760011 RepID=F4GJK8_PARC1|nr:NAD(P)H-dependent oxidoreductase [Parasphaerochaeta coccoides]AEC02755.1 NADPH-dependent FMN reductase [Parasphaerochaeta coccoides DSM 17374]
MSKIKVGIVIGSLRKDSFSGKIANVLAKFFPQDYEVSRIDISNLPVFDQDYDDTGTVPASWERLRKDVAAQDAFLFVTPEHNRSFPAALKNVLDIASRPWGKNLWDGKPTAIVSVTPGRLGAFGANHHLRQVLAFLNMQTLQQPEAYVGDVAGMFDDKGAFIDAKTEKLLQRFVLTFTGLIGKIRT